TSKITITNHGPQQNCHAPLSGSGIAKTRQDVYGTHCRFSVKTRRACGAYAVRAKHRERLFMTNQQQEDSATVKPDARVERVVAFVRHTLHEPPDYAQLARLANLSYCQLFRLCKLHLGLSLQQFIERERIAYAKRLLTMNHLSVKEVAAQVGYANQLYFSRRFQRAVGVSPTQFRADQLADPEKALHPYSYYMGMLTTERTYGSSV
ncbi:MAG TPA: AraC family transcriptional regulator, partial [Kiritimatiellia bacterium]|nr:AraC family transcriptional regulator [Kiritimatiellia bacterium]